MIGSSTSAAKRVWERFLSGRTDAQRFVIALGALAAAVLAIAAVSVGAARLLKQGAAVAPAREQVRQVQNQQRSADELVRLLLTAARTRTPVQLDHQVLAPRGPGGEYRLEYSCGATGCSFVRLETPADTPVGIAGGVWYQGCWQIAKDGNGYGADHLDLELRRQGEICPD